MNDPSDPTGGNNGTTWLFSYDLGGNILTKTAYPYTEPIYPVSGTGATTTYTYGNTAWRDQLTEFNGVTIQYDSIGNPTNDGTWQYTWQHGKQLRQMQKTVDGVTTTVHFEYNEDGLRTKKTVTVGNDTVVTEYVLHGKNIVHMTRGTDEMHFFYDAEGRPAVVVFNGISYRYLYTLQGDVLGLVDGNGAWIVSYRYDAWGKPLGIGGSMAGTLGALQPFRYRRYVYDEETECFFISSRYYNPQRCRWINEDVFVSTGQGFVGCNMFAYCLNNPVDGYDPTGFARNTTDDYNENEIPDYLEERWVELTNCCRAFLNGVECRDVTDEVNAALNNAISEFSKMNPIEKWFNFYNMVKDRGPWDIKRPESWEKTIGTDYPGTIRTVVIYEGHYYTPEILGNYTYGVLGKACGFDLDTLFKGSMYAANYPTPGTYQYDNEMQDRLFIVNGFIRER